MKDWKETDQKVSYYFKTDIGLIIGQVHNIAHTNIWTAKILLEDNQEKYIGQYVSHDFAKKSVERFWLLQENTLEYSLTE